MIGHYTYVFILTAKTKGLCYSRADSMSEQEETDILEHNQRKQQLHWHLMLQH